MDIDFRQCVALDIDTAVPLIYSSGPAQFRYVFSVAHEGQALEFLRYAFQKGKGQFGYLNHTAVIENGQQVGVGAAWSSDQNVAFLLSSAMQIFSFYGFLNGLKVVMRGLKIESIVKPAKKGVLYLGHLGISPSMQGKGCGRKLIAYFSDEAKRRGISKSGLDVVENNQRAKVLYQSLGFKDVERNEARLESQFGLVLSHDYMELEIA